MKKIRIIFTTVLFLSSFVSYAQVHIGLSTGYHSAGTQVSSGISETILPEFRNIGSPTIGLIAEVGLDNKLSLVSGLHFKQKGFTSSMGSEFDILGLGIPVGVKVENRLNYIEVPVHLKFSQGNDKFKAFISAGPSLSVARNGTIRALATSFIDIELTDRSIDFSDPLFNRTNINGDIALGGEMAYGIGKIQVSISYGRSFGSFLSDNVLNADLTHSGMTYSIGYSIAL